MLHSQVNAGLTESDEQELLRELRTPDDTLRVTLLRQLAEYYIGVKTDTALVLAREALDLSEEVEYDQGKIFSLYTMAKIFVFMGNYPRGLELYLQSLEISEREKDYPWVTRNLSNIGEVYGFLGDYKESLRQLFRGAAIAEENQLFTSLAKIYMNVSANYDKLMQPDSASYYIRKSYALIREHNDDDYLYGKILYALGLQYDHSGDGPGAMKYYRESMVQADSVEDYITYANATLGIAGIYERAGQGDSGLYYARRSLGAAVDAGFVLQELNATLFIAGYYQSRSRFDSAFTYLRTSVALKDSLLNKEKINEFQRIAFSEQLRQQEIKQERMALRNKVRMFILLGGISALVVVAIVLWRNVRLKQKSNLLLTAQKREIDQQKEKAETSYRELKATQSQLIHSEKMASLGELTAGIAHEIQNPLNFVNNFSELNKELLLDLKRDLDDGKLGEVRLLVEDMIRNEEKVNHHGRRADAIVKSMLQHSRGSSGKKEVTDINALCDEYLRLSFHGLRAKDKSFNASFTTDFDTSLPKVNVVPQDVGRVLLNLVNNAFFAVQERAKQEGAEFKPVVTVSTKKIGDKVEVCVKDNGNGIPESIRGKIFQPFFTTKPTGLGTGLGLSLSYDIIRSHGGDLTVTSQEGAGTTFRCVFPIL